MGPLLSTCCERLLVDYEEKADSNFVVAVGGFWFECYRELAPHFATFHNHLEILMSWSELDQYSPMIIMFNERPLVDRIEKID
jgi:hypothetical protein